LTSLTILTATYNRANKLENLYASLKAQTNSNFIWQIVDDGSTDCTKSLIKKIQNEAKFPIRYVYKQNGGRHTAINTGVELTETEMVFPVDSDDILSENAVETILEIVTRYKGNKKVGFFAFQRITEQGATMIKLRQEEFIANYIDYRIKGNLPGDMAEVFYTEVLKMNPFPVFENERFLSEDVCWIEIAKMWDTVFIKKPIYVCQYLEDGLTRTDKQIKFASPKGSVLRGKQLMYSRCGLMVNIKGSIIYNCYIQEIKEELPPLIRLTNKREKLLVIITKPIGYYYNFKWKKLDYTK